MKLSTRSRYGLRLMIVLAGSSGSGPRLLKEIADTEDLSEKYLGQLVIPLKSAGLIHAVRGSRGGYELAKKPQEIRPLEILNILEGNLFTEEAISPESPGSQKAAAFLWARLNRSFTEILSSVTLADLARTALDQEHRFPMYSI